MKRILIYSLAFLFASMFLVNCQQETDVQTDAPPEEVKEDPLKRGEYLITIMGCDDCHTPKKMGEFGPEPDMDRRFAGQPANEPLPEYQEAWVAPGQWILTNNHLTGWVGPWGTSYSANISSHDSGIGAWDEETFVRCLREGKYKGLADGRPLLPPMPWAQFRHLTDEDISAIFAFLQSSKPIENVVPAAKINPPPG